MKIKNSAKFTGDVTGSTIHVGDKITRITKPRRLTSEYPEGSIGRDLHRRNYVKYLVERYHRYRDADKSFGRGLPFSYAVIYKNIERKFQAPAYYIPASHFEPLVEYLESCIERTILGKKNRARGIANFKSFDEYLMENFQTQALS